MNTYNSEEEEPSKYFTPKDLFIWGVALAIVTTALLVSSFLVLIFWWVIK